MPGIMPFPNPIDFKPCVICDAFMDGIVPGIRCLLLASLPSPTRQLFSREDVPCGWTPHLIGGIVKLFKRWRRTEGYPRWRFIACIVNRAKVNRVEAVAGIHGVQGGGDPLLSKRDLWRGL